MSTSYSIYRFAKPTKYELAGIDYFSEYDSFYLHDSDGEQTVGCIRLFRSTDKEIANIISSKFVRPLVLPEKVTDYEKLYCEMIVQTESVAIKMECLWNSEDVYSYIDKKRVWEYIPALQEYRFVSVSNNVLAKGEIPFLIFERNTGKQFPVLTSISAKQRQSIGQICYEKMTSASINIPKYKPICFFIIIASQQGRRKQQNLL